MNGKGKVTGLVALLSAAALSLGAAAATSGGRSEAKAVAAGAGNPSVKATLVEFKLIRAPKQVAKSGKVTFVVKNAGKIPHEFVVLRTDRPASKLSVKNGRAVETGRVTRIGGLKPGLTKTLTLNLKPGRYALICNLPGHYTSGQFADFTVGVAPPPAPEPPPPPTSTSPPPDPAEVKAGEQLYQTSAAGIGCARCHGLDARGKLGPKVVGKSPAAIKQAIGLVAQMAPFQDLTDGQIQAISAYLKTLPK